MLTTCMWFSVQVSAFSSFLFPQSSSNHVDDNRTKSTFLCCCTHKRQRSAEPLCKDANAISPDKHFL